MAGGYTFVTSLQLFCGLISLKSVIPPQKEGVKEEQHHLSVNVVIRRLEFFTLAGTGDETKEGSLVGLEEQEQQRRVN